ncbi:Gfo/Idh/MocA family protein [Bacteroidota bacterium]
MKTRRKFIGKLAAGVVSAYSLPAYNLIANPMQSEHMSKMEVKKKINIGIIGAENSHTRGYGKLFNIDKQFPGVEVKYVWGETEEFAKDAMERGGIPNMVKDPNEMLGKIDALIVDHRHAKYHLDPALPFVEAGIPSFIDKPFCYRADEGLDFLRIAREKGTPVSSYSGVAHSYGALDMKEQVAEMGDINHVVWYGPVDIESKWGGIFFYGVHIIQPMMVIFGEDIDRVRVSRNGKNATASIAYQNGMMITLILIDKFYGWKTVIELDKGLFELKSRVEEPDPPKHYVDMVEMFKTGKEPRDHQRILNCVSVLEALERSVITQKWEKVNYLII